MSRSQWKFNYIANDLRALEKRKKNKQYILRNRSTFISTSMVGYTLKVYNGKRYFSFLVQNDKLGHLTGEFAPSKKKALKKKKVKVKKKKVNS